MKFGEGVLLTSLIPGAFLFVEEDFKCCHVAEPKERLSAALYFLKWNLFAIFLLKNKDTMFRIYSTVLL